MIRRAPRPIRIPHHPAHALYKLSPHAHGLICIYSTRANRKVLLEKALYVRSRARKRTSRVADIINRYRARRFRPSTQLVLVLRVKLLATDLDQLLLVAPYAQDVVPVDRYTRTIRPSLRLDDRLTFCVRRGSLSFTTSKHQPARSDRLSHPLCVLCCSSRCIPHLKTPYDRHHATLQISGSAVSTYREA